MEKTLIIYWSETGNTEAMAEGIQKGLAEAGAEVDVFEVSAADPSLVDVYSKIAFGCPSMSSESLEEDEFEPFFESIEDMLEGKKVALFGSYDWGDGEWMIEWAARTKAAGANLMGEGFIANLEPDEAECREFGKQFARF